MFSRSRALVLNLLLVVAMVAVVSGCKKGSKQAEVRLPNGSGLLTADASGKYGTKNWSPDGAPTDGSLGTSGSMNRTGTDAFGADNLDSATGDLVNNASTDGVEDGTFVSELEMIHFDFDSSDISEDWKQVLNGHAAWINSNAQVMVQIEGHCDERGTEEYNLALGQRRADSVRTYLASQGVDPNRLSTISYGKMRPLSYDGTEEAHALNRRAMFLVYEVDSPSLASAAPVQ